MPENLARVVTTENLTKALEQVIYSNESLNPSTKFDLLYKGKRFPPKEIVRKAAQIQKIKDWWTYRLSGGESTNKPLRAKGFEIVNKNGSTDPIETLIEQYKQRIRKTKLQGEIYKWKLLNEFHGRPNLNAQNFYDEIYSINFSNLIYPVGITVIRHIAKERPENYRACFKTLFNENLDLKERLNQFSNDVLKIYREMGVEEKFSHHHDERTCATFLTYHDPANYTFYKDSFYQKYCKLIGEASKKKGEKYVHYLTLIEDLIEDYIIEDSELLNLVSTLMPPNVYEDSAHKLLAQDILYQMLDLSDNSTKKYWRIGTKDEDGNYWDVMHSKNYVSIGWSDLGDLSDLELNNKATIENRMREIGYYNGDNRTISRKSGEIFDFVKTIKEGDIVLAQDGTRVLGIGIITDDYGYDEDEAFPHYRLVQWKVINPDNFFSEEGKRTTVYQIKDSNTISKIEDLLKFANPMNKLNFSSRNIILYGPPGTGKTYNSVDLAVKLIDGTASENHNDNKSRFDELRKEGQIEFITFHQNYSYEDFIVGISPDVTAGNLRFDKKEGIFKQISDRAKSNWLASINPAQPEITFKHVFNSFFKKLIEEEVKEIEIPMASKGYSFKVTSVDLDEGKIKFTKQSGGKGHDLLIKNVRGIYEGTLDYGYEGLGVYYYPLDKKLKEHAITIASAKNQDMSLKNYVLIIDEINRANISKVFGELITLLEDDKRLGEENELKITLPNGERDFGIPPNLYMVGTMNTADKSIALIDIALRRRFEFIGYYPKYETIKDDLKLNLLQHINKTVYEKKKSADYLIGHAYFLNTNPIESVLRNKVVPLLMEYFNGKTDIVSEIFNVSGWSVNYNTESYSWTISQTK